MIKLIVLFSVGVITRQAYCDAPEKIVGGNYATQGQFKHQVSLEVDGEHICGGSIISDRHILTAAHCLDNDEYNSNMMVITGTISPMLYGGEKHKIKCIRLHPDYTGEKETAWKNDIAVITLEEPITFNRLQGPIRLASVNHVNGGKRGIISGWGRTDVNSPSSPMLKWLEVNVLSQERCLNSHKNPPTNKNHICTLEKIGQGACQGDSGGPLVVDGELIGVVSWVLPCAMGATDVFTNVYSYIPFIKQSQSMC